MYRDSLSQTKWPYTCQRCGGQIVRSYDDYSCLQCGAQHTRESKLLQTQTIQEMQQTGWEQLDVKQRSMAMVH